MISDQGREFIRKFGEFHRIADRINAQLYYATPLIWLPDIELGKATLEISDGWYAVISDRQVRVFPTSVAASKAYVAAVSSFAERGFVVHMALPGFRQYYRGKTTLSEMMFCGPTIEVATVHGRDASYIRRWEREASVEDYRPEEHLGGCASVSKAWHRDAKSRYFRTYGRSKEQWLLEHWPEFTEECATFLPTCKVVRLRGEVVGFSTGIMPTPTTWANQFRRALPGAKPNQLSYYLWVLMARRYESVPMCLDGTAPSHGLRAFKEKAGVRATNRLVNVCKSDS